MMMDIAPVRRRKFSVDFKRRVVAESFAPGQSTAGVAHHYGLNANLLLKWRRDVRFNGGKALARLLPVDLQQVPASEVSVARSLPIGSEDRLHPAGSRIEVALGCGSVVRFGQDIGEETLYRVVSALRRVP